VVIVVLVAVIRERSRHRLASQRSAGAVESMTVLRMRAVLERIALGAVAMSLTACIAFAADDSPGAWAALVAGGHVALIRHGNAPPGYGGDPPGFKIDDCATQRNLDERGREQARALGEAFRKQGVRVDRVLSSPWCRCLDTARLMAVGPVEASWALVPDIEPGASVRLRDLKRIVSAWRGPGTLVLVTHALTVRALLGFLPGQAETVVVRPEPDNPAGAHLVGLITPPH
jgi:broad specificity phosphatase PhoE